MRDSLRVLFIDDDSAWLNALRRTTQRRRPGWELRFVEGGAQALELMQSEAFDVVVSDLNMPGMRGDSLLDQIAEKYPETLRFLLSGADSRECVNGKPLPAMEFISKTASAQELLTRIARGVTLRRFMRARVADRLAETISRLGDLPDLTMRIRNSGESDNGANAWLEVSCPELGLEFRTMLPG